MCKSSFAWKTRAPPFHFYPPLFSRLPKIVLLATRTTGVTTATQIPMCDGYATSYPNCGEKVTLWDRICPLGSQKRAATLFSHMSDVARRVCMTLGKDLILNNDGVQHILRIQRGLFAPDAIDCVLRILPYS